ncbi:MAG: NAD(P)/FAD-dependent oxidoreductase [Planctomycetia bacterium]|nr:NAD(P)/FAD-dependent oxidoreductase [Planctomycetia bacterium]
MSYGVETVVENKGRVFPKSQKADSILKALVTYMHDHQVTIQTNSQVLRLKLEGGRISGCGNQSRKYFWQKCPCRNRRTELSCYREHGRWLYIQLLQQAIQFSQRTPLLLPLRQKKPG